MNYKKACLQQWLADNTPRCSVLRVAGPLNKTTLFFTHKVLFSSALELVFS
jgi:hypothetical protein